MNNNTAKFRPLRLRGTFVAALLLLCIAGCLRFTSLSNLPGMNADETDMGVRILQMLHHEPYSLRSHTNQFFNPLFIACEAILFRIFPQNFYLLRLPAGVFAVLGILLLVYGMGKIYRDWPFALGLGALVACFPTHMIFSRLGWDPTFELFWAPVLLYLSMRLLQTPKQRDLVLLILAIVFSIWTHLTMALFVMAIFLALFWIRRDRVSTRCGVRRSNLFFAVCIFSAALLAWIGWWIFSPHVPELMAFTPANTLLAWQIPGSTILHLRYLGDLLSSYSSLQYVAGYPESSIFHLLSWLAEALFFLCCWKLSCSQNLYDRFLLSTLLIYLLLVLLASGFLDLQMQGHQRYVMPAMILLPLVIARSFPKPTWMLLICIPFLAEYFICFEQPMLESRYAITTALTFWTGPVEPKAEAAEIVLRLASAEPKDFRPVVYTNMFWMETPLKFLLFGHLPVRVDWPGAAKAKAGDFVVGFALNEFVGVVISQLTDSSRVFKTYPIYNGYLPQVMVIQVIR